MKTIVRLSRGSLLVGVILFGLGFSLPGMWPVAVGLSAAGLLWALTGMRLPWISSLGLVFFTFAGMAGILLGAPSTWFLLGMVCLLSSWDLDHFLARLQPPTHQLERLIARHLYMLVLMDILAIVFIGIFFTVHLQIAFAWIFILVLFSFWGLMKAIHVIRGDRARE